VPIVLVLGARFGLFRPAARGRPDRQVFGTIWRLGWPSSTQLVVRILAMLLTQSLVARAFTTEADQSATTALGIVFRLETMALFVGMGWGSAAQTFVGQNLGATNLERAKQSGWYAAAYNGLMMGCLAIAYVRFGPAVVAFFDDDPAVLSVALSYLRWVALGYVGLGVGIVLGAAMQGAGATLHALILDLFVVFCFQLPASLLVLAAPGRSPEHVWQVVALTYIAFGLVYAYSYKKGRFLRTVIA
jgi:Na+-driven multidrug efflux pump